jgi:RNA polymerase sigma-70 factor (ECF subfamily)
MEYCVAGAVLLRFELAIGGKKAQRMGNDVVEGLDQYVQELTACQSRLRGYILASLGNYADTADVLQRANLTLWKKAREFRTGAEFLPWALTITRYEILAYLRDHRRERLVFSDDVAKLMLDVAASEVSDPGNRQVALRQCLEKLPHRSRELLWRRYDEDKSIRQIATDTERTEDSVKCLFLRIRKTLEHCVEATLKLDTT